jgi:hypothetical protein
VRCPIETQENLELLLDYGTARISKHDALAFEQHLRICPACCEAVAGQLKVQSALDFWEIPDVSASFNRRLYERIEQTPGWRNRLGEAMSRALHVLLVGRGVPAAAAACLVITAGIMTYHQPKPAVPKPQTVQVETAAPEQVVHALDDMEMLGNIDRAAPAGQL